MPFALLIQPNRITIDTQNKNHPFVDGNASAENKKGALFWVLGKKIHADIQPENKESVTTIVRFVACVGATGKIGTVSGPLDLK